MHKQTQEEINRYEEMILKLQQIDSYMTVVQEVMDVTPDELRPSVSVGFRPSAQLNIIVTNFKDALPTLKEFVKRGWRTDKNDPFYQDKSTGTVIYNLGPAPHKIRVRVALVSNDVPNACRRVQVGERTETYPVYEIICPDETKVEIPVTAR